MPTATNKKILSIPSQESLEQSKAFADKLIEIFHKLKELGHEPLVHENLFGVADGTEEEVKRYEMIFKGMWEAFEEKKQLIIDLIKDFKKTGKD